MLLREGAILIKFLRWEVPTETSSNTQPSAVIGDTNFELNDDNTIEILLPAKDSVTSINTGVTAPPSNSETNSISKASDTPQLFHLIHIILHVIENLLTGTCRLSLI